MAVHAEKRSPDLLLPSFPSSILPYSEASAFCRRLAAAHYENFTVASWLLPRGLRTHFCHLYAYCRAADDLADESESPAVALALLDAWQAELDACFAGEARHPVFIALRETIREFDIPRKPLVDLLVAFRQDQSAREYETFSQLLEYCRNSANPVGRLVLYLGRAHDEERARLADSICTGLQLANFWQDVSRDLDKGRIYLPREDRARFGYTDEALHARTFNESFRELLRFEVDRAETYLLAGAPLVKLVPRELRIDVDLFVRGGLAILAAIRRAGYNVWRRRPVVNKWAKAKLLGAALLRRPLVSATRGKESHTP